ncbi:hypothetical protein NC651_037069 [Populus alba x Populus x berolinensis]|nr:hypothetical protein NC651_037069 [Populus alba x Populus x berolinensis]
MFKETSKTQLIASAIIFSSFNKPFRGFSTNPTFESILHSSGCPGIRKLTKSRFCFNARPLDLKSLDCKPRHKHEAAKFQE